VSNFGINSERRVKYFQRNYINYLQLACVQKSSSGGLLCLTFQLLMSCITKNG